MKIAFKYGLILGIILSLHTIFFYFFNQRLLFSDIFSGTGLWYILLYAIFMLLAIQKNSKIYTDNGTYFKIAWVTMVTAMLLFTIFKHVLFNQFSTELDPIYLEAFKENKQASMEFFGDDPLKIYEEVELLDENIKENFSLKDFLIKAALEVTLIAIFFSAIITNFRKLFFRKWFLKLKEQLKNKWNMR